MRGARLDELTAAHRERRAIAALSTYTLESTVAICRAAERAGVPAMLQAGSSTFAAVGFAPLAHAALAAADECAVAIGVHLDHSRDVDEITSCVLAGYTSVMIDGSHLPFDDNTALTRTVVELAHAHDVWVEAELGSVPGEENTSVGAAGDTACTDPAQAALFVERTGVDALAVAVGNVHGISEHPPELDLTRLAAIADATDVPLVLHGASGVADDALRTAVSLGVAKVNFNTELRRAYRGALTEALRDPGDDVVALQRTAIGAMAAVAEQKIRLLCEPAREPTNR